MKKLTLALFCSTASLLVGSSPAISAEKKEQPTQPDLPPPQDGKIYTLDGLDKAKIDLDGKIVKVRISPSIFKPEQVTKEEYRVTVQDDAKAGNGFATIYFPKEGLQKMSLLTESKAKKPPTMTFYILVSPDKFVAVGRSTARDIKGKLTYYW